MRYWVYKCNVTGQYSYFGDWDEVFSNMQPSAWGSAEENKALGKLQDGDLVLAYQTDRNELVGVARVEGFKGKLNNKNLFLKPIEEIRVRVRPLKKAHQDVARIPALTQGPIQTIYDITDADAELLLAVARQNAERQYADQGYAVSSHERRAIENWSMQQARKYYESKCFNVKDVHANKPFDLECQRGNKTIYVEVKGTRGSGETVLLTRCEVQHAQKHPRNSALFVVFNIQLKGRGKNVVGYGGRQVVFYPWCPKKSDLQPSQYTYRVKS
ncbi:MAG: DUF3883 domain-containing protein [Deltaproteobacteria bacterium]|nr:DUF3883 domain-containing protein [Deltaproteobacteria bacterium]